MKKKRINKFVYRYIITDSWGKYKKLLKRGDIIISQQFKGKEYAWNFSNIDTWKPIGGYSGILIGKVPNSEYKKEQINETN